MTDREQTRRLAEAATPGPWTYDGRDIFTVQMTEGGGRLVLPLPETWHESQQVNKADARYIAAVSPDVVLALLAELELAEQECDDWKAAAEESQASESDLMARLAKADKLAEALRDVEGSLLAYWTDISEDELQRLLTLTRPALAEWEQV